MFADVTCKYIIQAQIELKYSIRYTYSKPILRTFNRIILLMNLNIDHSIDDIFTLTT